MIIFGFPCLYLGKTVKTEWISDKIIEDCFGSSFSDVLGFHNSFLYILNFTDIFIVVQKIISWKAGESELICLHGGSRLCRFAGQLSLSI